LKLLGNTGTLFALKAVDVLELVVFIEILTFFNLYPAGKILFPQIIIN
jgi:hypothetical protein